MDKKVRISFEKEALIDLECKPTDFECYSEEDIAAWGRDEWNFVGIRAKANIHFPHGNGWITASLSSPGLWGIDSNEGEDYLKEVFEEQKAILIQMINSLHSPGWEEYPLGWSVV